MRAEPRDAGSRSACWSRWPKARTATRTTCTRWRARSTGRSGSRPQHTLRVDTTATRSPLRSLNFAALRVKDAVCDAMRESHGERPSVDTRHPDLPLLLHLGPERASLYVDTSGEPLFKRGWREDKGDAPLKETLAAAMLAAAGWRGTPRRRRCAARPLLRLRHDRDRGGADRLRHRTGLKRRFAFERLLPFADADSRAEWQRMKSHAQSRIHAERGADPRQRRLVPHGRLRAAQCAARRRRACDHRSMAATRWSARRPTLPDDLPGTLMLNPPYGERIDIGGKAGARRTAPCAAEDDNRALPDDFFARLASHWKRAYTGHPAGWTAYVLSPDMKLPSAMRLKEARRMPMWNGPIECRLFRFDLVAGLECGVTTATPNDLLSRRCAKRDPGQRRQRRGVGAQHARAEAHRTETGSARLIFLAGARPPSGPLRKTCRPHTDPIGSAAASELASPRRLSTPDQPPADGSVGRPTAEPIRQAAHRLDARHRGAAALLAGRHRHRLPMRRPCDRRARRAPAAPSARRPAAASLRRRARSPSRPMRPCARWSACRPPASPAHGSSGTRRAGLAHPHRNRAAAHLHTWALPFAAAAVEQTQRIAGLQAQHLGMAGRG